MIAGAVVAASALIYFLNPYNVYSLDLGLLTSASLSPFFAQLMAMSLFLAAMMIYQMFPKVPKTERGLNALYIAAAVIGFVLAAEGLALINISITSTNSTGSFTMVMTGLQSFCLGGLAISTVVIADVRHKWLKDGRGHLVLLFLLLLFPAAFLLT